MLQWLDHTLYAIQLHPELVHAFQAQKELGLVLTPLEQTLLDMARTAVAVGIVKKSDQSAEEPPNKKPKS